MRSAASRLFCLRAFELIQVCNTLVSFGILNSFNILNSFDIFTAYIVASHAAPFSFTASLAFMRASHPSPHYPPKISNTIYVAKFFASGQQCRVDVSEWLMSSPRKRMGSSRARSNRVIDFFFFPRTFDLARCCAWRRDRLVVVAVFCPALSRS